MGNTIKLQYNDNINESNWLQFALNHYENPHLSSLDEFEEDVKRFSYLLSLFNRYARNKDDLKLNLIINHIVIILNCFGVESGRKLLFYKLRDHESSLGTILMYLNICSEINTGIDHHIYDELTKL